MGGPQRHTRVGRNHPGAPGHPPPLNHRTHHHLDTTDGPPRPPLHRPRGCHHHTNGGRPQNSSPLTRHPHTPASINCTYDGTSGPHPMASHRHHLPHPQRPHTHLAATVGGHPWGPPPRTTRADAHPPHLQPVRGVGQAPHGIHTPGLWAYATPIDPQAAEDIKTALSIQQAQTKTPHCNTQRGYTIWWGYQDHDTLTPKPAPPPPWTPTQPPSSKPQQRQPHR